MGRGLGSGRGVGRVRETTTQGDAALSGVLVGSEREKPCSIVSGEGKMESGARETLLECVAPDGAFSCVSVSYSLFPISIK